jgi:hypothetical protein
MREWVKGSFMESSPQAMSQANSLRQIEDFYGKPQGYDSVKEATVTLSGDDALLHPPGGSPESSCAVMGYRLAHIASLPLAD